jgi:hypothetical protein
MMNPEQEAQLTEVKSAIAVQHNEYSSPQDRQRAFEFCNQLKENADWSFSFFLMHQQNTSIERHFGGMFNHNSQPLHSPLSSFIRTNIASCR